ncbi:MAG TPA: hypothetical protein VF741_00695 [Candidatus Aquilonibacter sp.]
MKQLALLALALLVTAAPALAQDSLAQNANERLAIMNLEYQLNWIGVTQAQATALQNQIDQIETKINTNGEPNLAVPAYGSCDADRGLIQYLQDQNTTDIDYQQRVDNNRAIHDLNAILKARGC